MLDQWREDNTADLVHRREHVVRGVFCLHLRGLRDQVVLHLVKADVEHYESYSSKKLVDVVHVQVVDLQYATGL